MDFKYILLNIGDQLLIEPHILIVSINVLDSL
jgi:hypothetical protein